MLSRKGEKGKEAESEGLHIAVTMAVGKAKYDKRDITSAWLRVAVSN